jgi:thioredoxin-related protein
LKNKLKKKLKKKSQLKELLMAALVLFQMLSYQKLNKNSIDLENPSSVLAVMKSTIHTTENYQATSYPARNLSIENTLQNA